MDNKRISHCNKENIGLVEALKLKANCLNKQIIRPRKETDSVKRTLDNFQRIPKVLVALKAEAKYASAPRVQQSALVQFAIKQSAKEFRDIPPKKTKKIHAPTWSVPSK